MTPTPTASFTPTPSVTPIICGSGATTGNFYYTDCCGYLVTGTTIGLIVSLDYTQPHNGINRLGVAASETCPTPTPTPTITPTETITPTLTETPTQTPTQTNTPSEPSPSPIPATFELQNESKVFTLFDMGITCVVLNSPSTSDSTDGSLMIKVTGGTSPYSYYWSNGQRVQTLTGLQAGDYEITVVDFYEDYTASTICSLVGPSPTPTPTMTQTPTPTPTASYPSLCLVLTYQTSSLGPIQFIYNGNQNDRSSWISGSYNLIWVPDNVRWEIQNWDLTSGIPISTSMSDIPLGSWVIAGGTGDQPNVSMTEGTCPAYLPLITNVSYSNNTCSSQVNCDGSITILTQGGIQPYAYSINNGLSYQTSNIFNGLCPNTYTVITVDATGNTQNQVVSIGSNSNPVSYTLNSVVDRIQPIGNTMQLIYWRIDVQPALPLGTTINFNLDINVSKFYNQPGTGTITYSNDVTQNGVSQSPISTTSSSITEGRPFCSPYDREVVNETQTYSLMMDSVTMVTGTTLSTLDVNAGQSDESTGCVTQLVQDISIATATPIISGCICCDVVNDPTPSGIRNTLQLGGTNQIIQ
jgi:hypothetical protein